MYKILRAILFLFPPESVHHFSMKCLRIICGVRPGYNLVAWICRPSAYPQLGQVHPQSNPPTREHPHPPSPPQSLLRGLSFRNPVGLGAGFDKNALYLRELDALGFGFVEIGTVTPRPQPGNPKPRLFRLEEDRALINRMGFNNDGVEAVAQRLQKWRISHPFAFVAQYPSSPTTQKSSPAQLIIGGNIGKNKDTPNEEAWKDYDICLRRLFGLVDYFVVNVSSPNTPGLRALQEKDALQKILTRLKQTIGVLSAGNGDSNHLTSPPPAPPLLLKIAPDLNSQQLDDVIELALEIGLDGLVATNTTISRDHLLTSRSRLDQIGFGGLSGAPVRIRSTEVVRYLAEQTGGRIPVIASGGVFTAADAREKIAAGADLIQVWTGFIYEGPLIVRRICG
jgi:dihydroorotate dehydrogenase